MDPLIELAGELGVTLGDWVAGWPSYDGVQGDDDIEGEGDDGSDDDEEEGDGEVDGGEGEGDGEEGEEGDAGFRLVSSSAAVFAIGAVMIQ